MTTRRDALRALVLGAAAAAVSSLFPAGSRANGATPYGRRRKAALSTESLKAAAPRVSTVYPYELPPLPYGYDALQAAIIERIMRIHHDRHHNGYTKKLNAALESAPRLQERPLVELLSNLDGLPGEVRTAVRNNGGGYFNHALFWEMLSPRGGGRPKGRLADAIRRDFGSFDAFKERFSKAAKTLFGSGWAWLAATAKGKLEILQTPNQDTPLASGHKPILGIDVWEHAYYLQYENRRAEYVDNFWKVVNWEQCGTNFGA